MASKEYVCNTEVAVMSWIMLRIDYSMLFWLVFGVFPYENHEGKPPII